MTAPVLQSKFTMGNTGNALEKSPAEQKLRKAATDFEAILLSKWWSAMRESGLPGSDDQSDPGHGTLDQLGMQALSTAVAQAGGLGIGAMLVHSLLSNLATAQSARAEAGGPAASSQKSMI